MTIAERHADAMRAFRAHDGRGLMETGIFDRRKTSGPSLPRARWARPHGNELRREWLRILRPSARTMGAASWKRLELQCSSQHHFLPRARGARPHGNGLWSRFRGATRFPSARTMGAASWKRMPAKMLAARWFGSLPRARWARPHGNTTYFPSFGSNIDTLPRARWARPHGNAPFSSSFHVSHCLPRARWARPHGNDHHHNRLDRLDDPLLPRARWARPHGNDSGDLVDVDTLTLTI